MKGRMPVHRNPFRYGIGSFTSQRQAKNAIEPMVNSVVRSSYVSLQSILRCNNGNGGCCAL